VIYKFYIKKYFELYILLLFFMNRNFSLEHYNKTTCKLKLV